MSKRSKYTAEEKYAIVVEYLEGMQPISEIVATYKISSYTIQEWRYRYEKYGITR